MSRVFAYCRVSKVELTTANQVQEIAAAGFAIDPKRTVTETISGSTDAFSRPGFAKLVDRLEESDVLIVTKLDRLGRNAMDIESTVKRLADMGVRVHCLQLGGADLTSPAGAMTMRVLGAFAQFEKDLLIERTQAGLTRAKAEGKKLGRPAALSKAKAAEALDRRRAGESLGALAKAYGVSRAAIQRLERKAA